MADDAYTALLERLASGDRAPSVPELLAQLGESDPRVAALARLLVQRQARSEAASEEVERPRPESKHRAVERLRRVVEDMYSELETLRGRSDELAAALGACWLCWGGDPDCDECRGQGTPGFRVPDRKAFVRLVAPAVRCLRPASTTNRSPSVTSEPTISPDTTE